MSIKTRIDKIETFFGYPLPPPIRDRVKADITDEPNKPAEQTDASFVDGFLDWKGEHRDGPNPAHHFLRIKCGGVSPPAQLRPKDPMRMALHFCGLFLLKTESKSVPGGWIQDAGYWVADANPRQDGIKTCPVYHHARGEKSGPYLVESPERLDAWRAAVSAIESLDAKVEAKKKPPLLKALMADFPWPVVGDRERLLRRGILDKKDAVPSVEPPADSEAERLSLGMEVCLPITEVLATRSRTLPSPPRPPSRPSPSQTRTPTGRLRRFCASGHLGRRHSIRSSTPEHSAGPRVRSKRTRTRPLSKARQADVPASSRKRASTTRWLPRDRSSYCSGTSSIYHVTCTSEPIPWPVERCTSSRSATGTHRI
jgi:hypothetical protein